MQGLIARSFIDELLNRADIVDFIDSYIPLKKRGTSHIACCPFHNEKTPSFNVIPKKQFYHCFGCGASGNIISFAMQHLQLSFPDAIETIAARVGLQVIHETTTERKENHLSLYNLLAKVASFYQKSLKNAPTTAIAYLKQRGISGEIAKKFQLGYAPDKWQILELEFKAEQNQLIQTGMLIQQETKKIYDRYRNRIMFPIHDKRGRIIGFGGRALDDTQKPKYLNSPETVLFQKNRELYGLYQIIQHQPKVEFILLVEGYLDVIALAQHGINNAVATLGTATSTYHIQLLQKHTTKILFCFDGDGAGIKAAWRALEICLPHLDKELDARFIFLPNNHDPDSFIRTQGNDAFFAQIKHAVPLNKFLFDNLLKDIDITSLIGKNQLISLIKPYLNKMPEHSYKQLIIDELSRITHIEQHRLRQLLEVNSSPIISEAQNKTLREKINRTPLRIAIALLLQHPELYHSSEKELNALVNSDKKYQVLQKIMQQIAKHESVNTALLVESWRDSPLFEKINQLASWDHQVPEDALTHEFREIINFLSKKRQENLIQFLIEKARLQQLSEDERHQLQTMLKQRHKS